MEAASVKWSKLGFGMSQMICVLSHELYVSSFPVDSSGQFFFFFFNISKTVSHMKKLAKRVYRDTVRDTLKIKVLVCRREGLKI